MIIVEDEVCKGLRPGHPSPNLVSNGSFDEILHGLKNAVFT